MQMARNPRKICSRIGFAYLTMLVVWLAAAYGLAWLLGRYAPAAFLQSGWALWVVNSLPLYLLGVPAFLLVMHTIPDGPDTGRITVPLTPRVFLLALVVCFGAMYLSNLINLQLIFVFESLAPEGTTVSNPASDVVMASALLPNLLFGVIGPAVVEEYAHRYVLRRKLRGCADSTYLFFSAVCFGLFHHNFSQMLYAMVLGFVFGWIYLQTNNILAPMGLHFTINLVGAILVPMAAENDIAVMLIGYGVLAVIVGAFVIFFRYRRQVAPSFTPPVEPGWPYKPPRTLLRTGYTAPPAQDTNKLQPQSTPALLLNPGMLLYMALTLGLAVWALLP